MPERPGSRVNSYRGTWIQARGPRQLPRGSDETTVAPLSQICGSSIIETPPFWIVTVLVMLPFSYLHRGNPLLHRLLIPALIVALFPIGTEPTRASDLFILEASTPLIPEPLVSVTLDSQFGSNIDGWSITLCHDPSSCEYASLSFGSSLANLGTPPTFHEVLTFPGGFTATCIIDNVGGVTLAPDANHNLYMIEYEWIPSGPQYSEIQFCPASPATPAVDSAFFSGGQEYPPITFDTFIFNGFVDPGLIYRIPRSVGSYNIDTGVGSVVVEPVIYPALLSLDSVTGLSMAVAHDPALLQIDSIALTGDLSAINGGNGPDLMLVELLSNGWTVDITFGPTGTETIDFPFSIEGLQANYSTIPGGVPLGSCVGSWLNFVETLGVSNEVNYSNFCCAGAMPIDDLVVLLPTMPSFLRGDCNSDNSRNLADAIFNLAVLFSGGGPITCSDACDHNDDGSIDISDPVYLLAYLFSGGPDHPEPNLVCGSDPTSDTLGCASNTCP